jgi:hypothetical protein
MKKWRRKLKMKNENDSRTAKRPVRAYQHKNAMQGAEALAKAKL